MASAVYEWNYAAQMIEIRLAEAEGVTDRGALARDVFSERFLTKRPLLQALERDEAGAPVLLIDELDRTDDPFEAFPVGGAGGFSNHHPRDRHHRRRRAADYHHYLEPHPRDPRRAEAAVLLPLDRLSRRAPRARDPARPDAGHRYAPRPRDRRLRPGAPAHRPFQASRHRRDHRLVERARGARPPIARSRDRQRHPGRALEVPGRHRQDLRATAANVLAQVKAELATANP